jgi:hypothetical protein
VADSGECKKSGSDEVQLAMSAVSGISCLLSGPGQKNGTQMIHPIDIVKRFGSTAGRDYPYLRAISLIIEIDTPALLASGRLNFCTNAGVSVSVPFRIVRMSHVHRVRPGDGGVGGVVKHEANARRSPKNRYRNRAEGVCV